MWMRLRCAPVLLPALLAAAACSRVDNLVGSDGGVTFADADPLAPDAGPNPGCAHNGPECNNCEDDDGDGLVDGFDPECTSSVDDREDSFATGIPGDNSSAVKQDCFYDGNGGSGNDGCEIHVCCLLAGECPFTSPPYDPASCQVSDECIANCEPITPPGCDCFGCCTICDDLGCADILTNPASAPLCDESVIHDASKCPPCKKHPACDGGECGSADCVLCPGQTEADLPPECAGHQCPGSEAPCDVNTDCLSTEFCSAGCCILDLG
jgi:hypothetical protein